MRCAEFQKRMMESARGQTSPERDALTEHAESCADCAQRLGTEQQLSAALAGLKQAYERAQAGRATAQTLLTQFRERRCSAAVLRSGLDHRAAASYRMRRFAVVAASFLIACITIWLLRQQLSGPARRQHLSQTEQRVAVVPTTTSPEHPTATTGEQGSRRKPILQQAAAVRHPRRAAAPAKNLAGTPPLGDAPDSRRTTAFFPTMYPTISEPDYGLQLIRVELPRKTMMSFGLPVDPRQLSSPVKADLIIGPDGLTRAIRFVQ